jgi:hypothetical protein
MLDHWRQGGPNGSSGRYISWLEVISEPHTTRKCLRTHEESDIPTEELGNLYEFQSQARKFFSSNIGSSTPLVQKYNLNYFKCATVKREEKLQPLEYFR